MRTEKAITSLRNIARSFLFFISVGAVSTSSLAGPLTYQPSAPRINAKSYVLIDANSGQVLAEKNADKAYPPASLTKMMTVYVSFHALKNKQISLQDQVMVSRNAWKMPGSRMFIEPRHTVSVDQLLQGIIVASGNDASVAMSEHIAGSETAFTSYMNQSAKYLEMNHSHFTDSTGLPHPDHYASAHDLGRLARAIVSEFPDYYHYFKEKRFTYNKITQSNRNSLLWRDDSVDGLKTGHTKEAGYCLAASAKKDKTRLVAVVMGTDSNRQRANAALSLLNWGFRFYESMQLYSADTTAIKLRVWHGRDKLVPVGVRHAVYLSIPKGSKEDLKVTITPTNKELTAPVFAGRTYAHAVITLRNKELAKVPLTALQNDPQGNLWVRFRDNIAKKFHQWLN